MTHTSERSSRAVQGMATAVADPMFRPLGAYFVEAGLISPAQVQVVLNDQEMTGLRFGEILVQRGWIKEKTVEYFSRGPRQHLRVIVSHGRLPAHQIGQPHCVRRQASIGKGLLRLDSVTVRYLVPQRPPPLTIKRQRIAPVK